ncbi:DUF192 domain-containing protein [Chengkuizengella axinellae]|uniref:DUF192 domain-containing protein n=1 Tax=Chengkuizengella axinellae TaxID=3064388 RepID=A0ABT9IYU7_9BACL|nr:DUF192 domain-containing protein [Chengkuizengella sp. 2205SS18-9]MDP5274488.1 DUF192 domain-containing protein [Chengkuizengella sp. 2205SS18-9]
MKVINQGNDVVIAEQVRFAHTFFSRFIGLMFKKHIFRDGALHILPCSQIHTFFMKFPIDVVYLNSDYEVVGIEENLSPWKIGGKFKQVKSIIELSSGAVVKTGLKIGDSIKFK